MTHQDELPRAGRRLRQARADRRAGSAALDVVTLVLWVVVIAGAVGVLLGWFDFLDGIDPIDGAWASPDGRALLLHTESGAFTSYEIPSLRLPLARSEELGGAQPLYWVAAPARMPLMVMRDGRKLGVLDLSDLLLRPWFETEAATPIAGIAGKTLVAIPDILATRLPTFALDNWEVGERPAAGPDSSQLPFDEMLPPAAVLPEGATLELADGALTLHHPRLDTPRRLAVPRPTVLPAAALFALALTLLVLRRVQAWRRRRGADRD